MYKVSKNLPFIGVLASDTLLICIVLILSCCGYFADPIKCMKQQNKVKAELRAKLIKEFKE